MTEERQARLQSQFLAKRDVIRSQLEESLRSHGWTEALKITEFELDKTLTFTLVDFNLLLSIEHFQNKVGWHSYNTGKAQIRFECRDEDVERKTIYYREKEDGSVNVDAAVKKAVEYFRYMRAAAERSKRVQAEREQSKNLAEAMHELCKQELGPVPITGSSGVRNQHSVCRAGQIRFHGRPCAQLGRGVLYSQRRQGDENLYQPAEA